MCSALGYGDYMPVYKMTSFLKLCKGLGIWAFVGSCNIQIRGPSSKA